MSNFIRKADLLNQFGFSKSTLHNKINSSVFPPPFQLGERAVAWPGYEIDAMCKAYIAGFSSEQLKALVTSMLESRKTILTSDENWAFTLLDDNDGEEHKGSTALSNLYHKEG